MDKVIPLLLIAGSSQKEDGSLLGTILTIALLCLSCFVMISFMLKMLRSYRWQLSSARKEARDERSQHWQTAQALSTQVYRAAQSGASVNIALLPTTCYSELNFYNATQRWCAIGLSSGFELPVATKDVETRLAEYLLSGGVKNIWVAGTCWYDFYEEGEE